MRSPLVRNSLGVRAAAVFWLLFACAGTLAQSESRFPQPDFESGYQIPDMKVPAVPAPVLETIDALVLIAALLLTAYAVLRRRRRGMIFAISLACLAYFGFWRQGCICPVGSVQNVAQAFCDKSILLPVSVLVFFAAPLIAALFFGRIFCGAVCPLGAIQDIVALHPVRLPAWLTRSLGMLPCIYLGLAILFVMTGSGFIVCRYDPFVAFFRRSGEASIVLFGMAMLLLGVVVARPYCRFLCPYGVILGWMSLASRKHAVITPDDCVQCRLCEDSCPFGAIAAPQPELNLKERRQAKERLKRVLLWCPVTLAIGWVLGMALAGPMARVNPTVRLAESMTRRIYERDIDLADRRQAFDSSGRSLPDLFAEANTIRSRFSVGTPLLGLFIALVVSGKLLASSIRRFRDGYEPDRVTCLSCGRCFAYCPREQVRRSEPLHTGGV